MKNFCISRIRHWCLLILCVCVLSGCKIELFGRLDEVDANAVMTVLYAEGINATKTKVDDKFWRIEVDEHDQQRALIVTRNQGVPRERFANMGDLFKKEGLVSTPSEVRMRYIFALSQELSSTLSNIDGVISARVHPVIPVNDPLSEKVTPASAAVFIKHLPDADLQQMAPAIKTLVTRSIEGLKVENVSLTFFPARAQSQALPMAHGGLVNNSDVSLLTISLAACLALTLGFLGWGIWRQQLKRDSVEDPPPGLSTSAHSSHDNNSLHRQSGGSGGEVFQRRRASDFFEAPTDVTDAAVLQRRRGRRASDIFEMPSKPVDNADNESDRQSSGDFAAAAKKSDSESES